MTFEDDICRPVKGLEMFCEASSLGKIYSVERTAKQKNGAEYRVSRRELSQKTNRYGYKVVGFWINGRRKMFSVHRLVMLAFVPEDEKRKNVNHKNGIRSDNRLSNLEWCSKSENAVHAYNVLKSRHGASGLTGIKNKLSVAIVGVHKETGQTVEFAALMDAQRSGFRACCISDCLSGKQKTHRNFEWTRKQP